MSDTNERSVASTGSVDEPVAWAVVLNAIEAISMNGGATYRVTANRDEAESIAAHAMAVVPLYERPQPALTDAERDVIARARRLTERVGNTADAQALDELLKRHAGGYE